MMELGMGFENPYDDLRRMQRRINRIFDDAFMHPVSWDEDWTWPRASTMMLEGRMPREQQLGAGREAGMRSPTTGGKGKELMGTTEGGQLGTVGGMGMWRPRFNVSETDKHLLITAEIPGVDRKDVKVDVSPDGRCLTISGEKKEEKEREGEFFHRCERRYGNFMRNIRLPEGIDPTKHIQARFENGVLEVQVEKLLTKGEGAGRRQIAIK